MSNFDTVLAITDNLRTLLEGLGICFSEKTYDDEKSIPASLLPLGEIIYAGESFEYAHGQRPGYAEAEFTLKVTLSGRSQTGAVRSAQSWVHGIRDALTVDALNTGTIAAVRSVSRVETKGVDVKGGESLTKVHYRIAVRYREA